MAVAKIKHDCECKGFPDCKEVGYAYPTSPQAERFGRGKVGCYVLSKWTDGKRYAVSVHESRAAAIAAGDALNSLPWGAIHYDKK